MTTIEDAKPFYEAEEYHQDFYKKIHSVTQWNMVPVINSLTNTGNDSQRQIKKRPLGRFFICFQLFVAPFVLVSTKEFFQRLIY